MFFGWTSCFLFCCILLHSQHAFLSLLVTNQALLGRYTKRFLCCYNVLLLTRTHTSTHQKVMNSRCPSPIPQAFPSPTITSSATDLQIAQRWLISPLASLVWFMLLGHCPKQSHSSQMLSQVVWCSVADLWRKGILHFWRACVTFVIVESSSLQLLLCSARYKMMLLFNGVWWLWQMQR